MPEFLWRAAHADGQAAEGRTEAAAEADVLRQLRERGLTPIRVQPAGQAEGAALAGPRPRAARGPVKPADVLSLTSELAIMLRAGLALDAALRVLIDMSHKPSVRAMLEKVLEDVKGGAPFSRALAAHQAHFGDFYINMIRSGEVSGQMPQVLDRLAGHMQRLRALRESVVSATLYPAILLGVAVLSLVGMLGFVVPQFEKLFKGMGDALPMPTRVVMLLGQGFRHYGLALGLGAAALGWLAWRWLRTPAGRQWWQARLIALPVLGPIVRKYQLTLFARSLGTLLDNGVPLLAALHISVETVTHQALRQALAKMAPLVKEGSRIVPAMRATGVFEPLAINLVRVGEETGRVGAMMNELAAILDRDVETGIKRGLTLLEPALILVLGLLIAAIIVSILLGIISVNDLVK
ncbi:MULTISPECIES: type II secretion system F family protein [Ottowia]|uniref:Type II secretion system F family protein n=1 Tax=Ottowia cancrivicina TaxID=3040346 RepID=A0AAW6RKC4_9BURK|nr:MULTISPECIES: type II secretion system F family protein [unclassified Ottowia]AKU66731.1 type II secretion system protein F [Ottowia sp. oral taxon 894]MDG9698981.1 type II secretion system F family protein [Ottowia sp. 10c7w1]